MSARAQVLLLASGRPARPRLSRVTQRLHALGAEVRLAVYQDLPADYVDLPLTEVHSMATRAQGCGPAFRRELRRADAAKQLWLHAKQDDWVLQHAQQATVIVALDQHAVGAARRLAKLSPRATVTTDGEQAARRLQQDPRTEPRPALPVESPSRYRLERVPTFLAPAVAGLPGLSDERRYGLARTTALRALESKRVRAAKRAVARALKRLDSPRLRADLLGDLANAALARGIEPVLARETYAAELAVADRHLARKRQRAAAESFGEAMLVAFHRVAHFDRTTSPLADDPGRFTAALRDSATAKALRAPRGSTLRPSSATKADLDDARPTRVVVMTRANDNFLDEIRDLLDEQPGFEARFLDLAAPDDLLPGVLDPALMAEEILTGKQGKSESVEERLRPHLDWADVVFLEWCSSLAVLLTMVDPGDTRVIVRLHSFEVFTPWPHMVDFSRVDDLLFVSDHLRDLAVAAIPALQEPQAPRLLVIPLGVRLEEYVRPKPDNARFTLGLVGWGSVVKDPCWAFEVLRILRRHDDRFQLRLIGGDFADGASAATLSYGEQVRRELAALESSGAVIRVGHTDDVPSALTSVGVILSSSVRESFHAGLVEGAASGAVPVVRDWPYFAGKPNSARTLFPSEWVVGSPEEAANRVRRTTASDEEWRAVGGAAADYAVGRWDWGKVSHDYERLLSR